jgi:hypothetical protein
VVKEHKTFISFKPREVSEDYNFCVTQAFSPGAEARGALTIRTFFEFAVNTF